MQNFRYMLPNEQSEKAATRKLIWYKKIKQQRNNYLQACMFKC